MSFTSGGSSRRQGSNGASGTSGRKHTSSQRTTTAAPAPAATTSTLPMTLQVPTLPHASSGLVRLDSFFALHRPLLELPIRLSARKSVTPIARLVSSEGGSASALDEDVRVAMEAMDGEELVEVVDLAPDGTPTGPSYITTLAASNAAQPLRTAEEEVEMMDLEAEATEAAMQDLEDGLPDPYDAWLIAEREPYTHSPIVSRYLASHPPFSTPPAPSPVAALPSRVPSSSSSLSPQALSDLSFLRPFPTPSAAPIPSAFASSFVSPHSPYQAQQLSDRFLSSALLTHRWEAHTSYALNGGEHLEVAHRAYTGVKGVRRGIAEKREKGEVRIWNDAEGWQTVDLTGKGAGSPFLPAEMIDLDWLEEHGVTEGGFIRMDSVRRKRKKMITKHKFKKRRSVSCVPLSVSMAY
jgi:hypothetical protein